MKSPLVFLLSLLFSTAAAAAALPGFRAEVLGSTSGFATSIVSDSRGTLYYSTRDGDLFRFDAGVSTKLAHLPTEPIGDSGLLGMALRDDQTAVVHYVTVNQTADVVSLVDLRTGNETILYTFIADITFPGRPAPVEHHGGNPIVAPDGSVFVAIGDYGVGAIAAQPQWNAGKIWRIAPDGTVTQFARGFRNPFDLAWDDARQRIVLTDNGAAVDDEIDIVTQGEYHGWPYTAGNQPPIEGAVGPRYVFPTIVAPTGMTQLSGRNALLSRGYLIGAFVSRSIYWVPDIDAPTLAPIALISGETSVIIDVTESPNGDIYFVTANTIYRLAVPQRGDCNGDGAVNGNDASALALELADGNPQPAMNAPTGSYRGSWGCDVNADGLIDLSDAAALASLVHGRTRVIRRR